MTVPGGGSAAAVYLTAAHSFADLVEAVPDQLWDRSGLGEWTVRDLVGHTSRALSTVITYVGQPAETEDVPSAAEYYAVLKRNAGRIDQQAVAQRGRQAGAALGSDPAGAVRAMVDKARAALAKTSGAELITTIGGGMRLEAYLPTRTFELAVHGTDIAAALGTDFDLPEKVMEEALCLAGRISLALGDGPRVLRALTGRQPLDPGYSVV